MKLLFNKIILLIYITLRVKARSWDPGVPKIPRSWGLSCDWPGVGSERALEPSPFSFGGLNLST